MAQVPDDVPCTLHEPDGTDLAALAALFDAYRVFYECRSDRERTKRFIEERLAAGVTRFFIAKSGEKHIGFVHLLPSFDTLGMQSAWILEDLFVAPDARRRGVGRRLLLHAEAFARENGASRLSLTTAHTNETAQQLYEALGWERDLIFRTYHRPLA